MGDIALGGVVLAGYRLVGGVNGLYRIKPGERLHGGQWEPCPDAPVLRHAVDDRAAQGPDARQDLRRDVGQDVHHHRLVCGNLDRRLPARDAVLLILPRGQ